MHSCTEMQGSHCCLLVRRSCVRRWPVEWSFFPQSRYMHVMLTSDFKLTIGMVVTGDLSLVCPAFHPVTAGIPP